MKKSEQSKASKREDGVDLISEMLDAIDCSSLASKSVDLDSIWLSLNDHISVPTIWRWAYLATMKNVKEIDLFFRIEEETEAIEFPRFLVAGFSALRVLDLTWAELAEDHDLVNDFLKSCPLLEDLSLVGCLIGEVVCISCPKLKKLCIVNSDDVGCHGIKICCPELADSELGGRILYGNSDSLLFHGNYHFKWAHLYFSFESIDAECDRALLNLKTFILRTTMEAFTVDELIRFLKCSPNLENLTLMIRKDFDKEYKWVDEAETRRIWTPDVKRVEFFEFNGEKPKLDLEWCENKLEMFLTFFWKRVTECCKFL